MFRRLKDNESGVVLIMVLMVTIVLMIFSIGILTRGTSQVKSVDEQVERIKAEQLAIGAYAKAYTDLASGSVMQTTFPATLDSRTYTSTVTSGAPGPNNTTTLTVTTPYPD